MNLKVSIIPNASKNEITGWILDSLKIKIAAPPEKGKANKELIEFLSKEWNIPKNKIEIKKGFKKRLKMLEIKADHQIPLPPKDQIPMV